MRWKIYYGDGSSYKDSNPFDAPALDVQMIANSCQEHGWTLCRNRDFYWYKEGEDLWDCGDCFSLWDYLSQPGRKKVIFGRTIGSKEYEKILGFATNDPEIPQKSGWFPGEK